MLRPASAVLSLSARVFTDQPEYRQGTRLAGDFPNCMPLACLCASEETNVVLVTPRPLFTDDAVTRIFEYTKGLPRRINQLCHTALMAGLIDQKSTLDESTIRKAIADIDHD